MGQLYFIWVYFVLFDMLEMCITNLHNLKLAMDCRRV
jgi:hypothetical protein